MSGMLIGEKDPEGIVERMSMKISLSNLVGNMGFSPCISVLVLTRGSKKKSEDESGAAS